MGIGDLQTGHDLDPAEDPRTGLLQVALDGPGTGLSVGGLGTEEHHGVFVVHAHAGQRMDLSGQITLEGHLIVQAGGAEGVVDHLGGRLDTAVFSDPGGIEAGCLSKEFLGGTGSAGAQIDGHVQRTPV